LSTAGVALLKGGEAFSSQQLRNGLGL